MPSQVVVTNHDRNAIVDTEDLPRVDEHVWYYGEGPTSVLAHVGDSTRTLQHFVLDTPPAESIWVGFRNDDEFDCRRSNLYIRDQASEAQKRPPPPGRFKGVTFNKVTGKWVARIIVDSKVYYLGAAHRTDREAALAYDRAAVKYYGHDAYVNFPKNPVKGS